MGTATGFALVALLASLCYVSVALPTVAPDATISSDPPVVTPNGKAYVYKYSASVAAGQNEPAPFASKLQINAKLSFKSQSNSYYFKFDDVQYAIYNGPDDGKISGKFHPIEEAINYFHQPFVVVYNQNHKVEGIKVQADEATWSKNMKKALASLFHLDRVDNETSRAYRRAEDTIYGECNIDYFVHSEVHDGEKLTVLHKAYEPRSCTKFVLFDVRDSKGENCDIPSEEDLVTAANRVYTYGSIKDLSDYVLKKISSHEKFSYLPWSHRNYGVQFIETNQTIEFEKVIDELELKLAATSFDDVKAVPLTFSKREYVGEVSSAEEINFGRHEDDIKQVLIPKVKKLLVQLIDFLKDNQIDVDEKNPEQKYLLESLYRHLGNMDHETLSYVFKHFNTNSEKGKITRKIFLRMIPHVGTQAAWGFVKDIVTDRDLDIEDDMKLEMLAKLPMYVLNPSEKFAKKVVDYRELENVSYKVKRAGVLCYSILLNKVYKGIGKNERPDALKKNLEYFNGRIKHENTYNNKILYMMAMRNVEVGNIYEYLAPIVKGEDVFYVDVMIEKREKYRVAAMWAVARSISHDYDLTYELFWPILSNSSNPLSLRITAYELLVPRNPLLDMRILTSVHDLMETEHDDHLFNYHYTTLKSNAESSRPCMHLHSEMMRKTLHLTKPRKVVSAALSSANVHDYYDTVYGHGKTFRMAAEINEATGIPQTGYYEIISTYSRRPKLTTGYYWNIDGINLNTIIEISKNLINPSSHISTEITDEKVQKILRQTQGYKLFDKHIHVELWTMDKGYVTNVQVFFKNGLTDFLRQLVNKYKPDPDQLMDVKKKFDINAMDISFDNHYKMILPTEMGLPAIFYNDVPRMTYTTIKPDFFPQKYTLAMKIEFDTRFHKHSVYQMKFYNPFADVTHSVQRHTFVDGALPIDATFSLQMPAQSLKLELPRAAKQSSAAGLKIHSVDQVVVDRDIYENYLQAHCPTCQNRTDITNGPGHKETNLHTIHHLDSGLEITYGMFGCEHNFEPSAEMEEWYRIFNSPRNNRKEDIFAQLGMIVDQGMFNYVNNPYTGTCGVIMRVAPCTVHPASHVEMKWLASPSKVGNDVKLTLRGSVDVKSSKTNETMRSWDIHLSTEFSRHLNSFTAKLVRKVPEEKNLKICFEAKKEYPKLAADVSKMEYKTHGTVNFGIGHSDGDDCTNDKVDVKAEITGERLEEQIEEMKPYVKPGSCFKNASNPLDLDIMQPFDWNCLYQSVKATTMRKYTVDVSYNKMPVEYSGKFQMLEDWARSVLWPVITYRPEHTDEGHAKIYITYPASKSYGNITFVNPSYTWELTDVSYDDDDVETRQNDLVFDNTAFPTTFLVDFYKSDIRPCIAHAHDLINDLNQTIPMEFKDWTLISGDHGLMSYAVFVKALDDDKVAVRIYVPRHIVEVSPGTTKPVVSLDGDVISYDDEEILLPPAIDGTNYYKISMVNKLLMVETEKYSKVKVYYTPVNVIVMPHIILDRNVDGVCGHMGSTVYAQQAPLVYGALDSTYLLAANQNYIST